MTCNTLPASQEAVLWLIDEALTLCWKYPECLKDFSLLLEKHASSGLRLQVLKGEIRNWRVRQERNVSSYQDLHKDERHSVGVLWQIKITE